MLDRFSNNIRNFVVLIVILTSLNITGQTIEFPEDSIKLTFRKAKKASGLINASGIGIDYDVFKRVRVSVKMKSLTGKRQLFDPNKLSLVYNEEKIRFRPTDVLFQNLTDWWDFKKASKTEPATTIYKYLYKPEIEDTFLNYKMKDVRDILQPVNVGSRKNPDIHIIHFTPKKLRSRNIHILFAYPKDFNQGDLYYETEKIASINIK